MKNCDGMVVWGESQDNVLLKQIAREMTSSSGGGSDPGRSRPGGGDNTSEDPDTGATNGKDQPIHVLVQGG